MIYKMADEDTSEPVPIVVGTAIKLDFPLRGGIFIKPLII